MKNTHQTLRDRINKSKVRLFQKDGMIFYSALLAQLKIEIVANIPWIAATNGTRIVFNPERCEEISNPQLLGTIFHELLHVVFDHVGRSKIKGLNPQAWNYAGDYLINMEVKDRGFELPDGALLDYKFKGKGTKEIYDIIYDPNEEYIDLDLYQLSPEEGEQEQNEKVINNLIKAATQVKIMTGSYDQIPGELKRQLDKLINPRLPWQSLLQRYVQNYAKNDYSWKRPNKRYWPDMYLPSLYSESVGSIHAYVDVSGSISQEYATKFISEITGLFYTLNPERLKIVSFDTKINTEQDFVPGDCPNIEIIGGGGTDLKDVIEHIETNNPTVSLIFTDGYFHKPNLSRIKNDLLWLIYDNDTFEIEKGEIIYVNQN